jgi:hypothetical protein
MSTKVEAALAEQAAAEAELAAALAELARVEAECKALGVDISKPKPSKKTKPGRGGRVVHHPESGLRSGVWGCGPAPVGERRVRIDDRPVVMKHRDAAMRPEPPRREGRECLYVHDFKEGRPESDSWMRCKCASCESTRRG